MTSFNPTLYTLTADLLELDAALREAEETGEDPTPILQEWLVAGEALTEKAERYGHLLRQREAEAAMADAALKALEAERERLRSRRETALGTVQRLKSALLSALTVLDLKRLQTETFTFRRQQNGGVPPLVLAPGVSPEEAPPEWTRPEWAKDRMRQALQAGEVPSFIDPLTGEVRPLAWLDAPGEHLRIV